MEQNKNKNKLTGILRLRIVNEWVKRGRQGDKEDFVKKACETLKLEYTLPPRINRGHDYTANTVDSKMFPVK